MQQKNENEQTHLFDSNESLYKWFSPETFTKPPAQYRVSQYVQGSKINIEKMLEMNLGGGVCGVSNSDDYLRNEASWQTLTDDMIVAREAGLITWIFDEKGYPSCCAGGLTVEGRPDLEARGIYAIEIRGTGKDPVVVPLPEGAEQFITASLFSFKKETLLSEGSISIPVNNRQSVQVNGPEGDWKLILVAEKIMFEGTHAYLMKKSWNATGHYPNLMDREAVKRFIDNTYEEYKKHIEDFPEKVYSFYTNEPSLMTHWVETAEGRPNGESYAPWEKSIPSLFRAKFGVDMLPDLFRLFSGDDPDSKIFRYRYYTIVGDLMVMNFSRQLTQWCESNGTLFSGHILCEENMGQHVPLFGDFIRVMGEFSIPGADMAIRKDPENRTRDIMGLKYVSSAARIYTKPYVQTLMDPILGGYHTNHLTKVIPIDVLLHNLNLLYFCGINVITTYGVWDQYEKEDYTLYNNYAGRLSVILREAIDQSRVAVYYPIETFQGRYIPTPQYIHAEHFDYADIEDPQQSIVQILTEQSIDFNFINADAILKSEIKHGVMKSTGHEYRMLILPAVEIMDIAVAEIIKQFKSQGGQVVFTDTIPSIATNRADTGRLVKLFNDSEILAQYEDIPTEYEKIANQKIQFVSDQIQTAAFVRGTHHMLFMMNQNESDAIGKLDILGVQHIKLFDPESGQINEVSLPITIDIKPYRALVAEYNE